MAQALYIQHELQELAPSLIGLQNNVYTIPQNYFIESEVAVLQLVTQNFVPKLKPSYTLPDGYFDTLSSQILQKIKHQNIEFNDDELKDIAPLLASIPKQNVYKIPQNYFDNLNIKIPKAKVVSFKKTMQYASAAAVIGVVALFGIKAVNNNKIKQEYAAAKKVNIEKSIEQISIDELQKGVNNTVAFNNTVVEPPVTNLQKILDVEESLQVVSDEELENYLQQNSEIEKIDASM